MSIRPRFQYISVLSNAIAVTPAWTLLTTTQFPALGVNFASNANAPFEFSLDGVSPFFFVSTNSNTVMANTYLDFKTLGLSLPKNSRLFARRVVAGVVGALRITLIGSVANV